MAPRCEGVTEGPPFKKHRGDTVAVRRIQRWWRRMQVWCLSEDPCSRERIPRHRRVLIVEPGGSERVFDALAAAASFATTARFVNPITQREFLAVEIARFRRHLAPRFDLLVRLTFQFHKQCHQAYIESDSHELYMHAMAGDSLDRALTACELDGDEEPLYECLNDYEDAIFEIFVRAPQSVGTLLRQHEQLVQMRQQLCHEDCLGDVRVCMSRMQRRTERHKPSRDTGPLCSLATWLSQSIS
jgi:hypothetical protein